MQIIDFRLGIKDGKTIASKDLPYVPRKGEIVGIDRTDYIVTEVIYQLNTTGTQRNHVYVCLNKLALSR